MRHLVFIMVTLVYFHACIQGDAHFQMTTSYDLALSVGNNFLSKFLKKYVLLLHMFTWGI